MRKNISAILFFVLKMSISSVFAQGGNALNFDGTNDYVELSSSINLANNSYTLECWFKATTQSGYFMVIGSASGGTRLVTGIKLNPFVAGEPDFGMPDTPSNIQFWMYGDDHYYNWTNDGNWHHVAFTFNSSNQLGTLYLDGTSVASATFGGNMTGSGKARLCASTWATDGPFTGELDEVRIWNSVRTATEISDNKNNISLSASTPGLVAYYHFDQGTAGGSNTGVTNLTDANSNTYNGSLTNFTLSGTTSNWVSSNNSALPVELTSFSANIIDSKVLLNWQTATEVNNYGFEIERTVIPSGPVVSVAEPVEGWKTLGFVQGHGNSNSPKNYSFYDASPLSGNVQYRLKQIDFDGKFEYSDIVETNVEAPANFALNQNHPNPFNPETTINYKVQAASQVSLKVFDVLGREVVTLVDEYKQPGNYIATFNTRHLERSREIPSGIYFYTLNAGGFSSTKKMLLIK